MEYQIISYDGGHVVGGHVVTIRKYAIIKKGSLISGKDRTGRFYFNFMGIMVDSKVIPSHEDILIILKHINFTKHIGITNAKILK